MEEEKQETLQETFERIKNEQQAEIEKLKKEIAERDAIIKSSFTKPSNVQSVDVREEDDAPFGDAEVKKVIEIIKRKRS